MSFFIAASHEYLKRNGAPESPEDLARHDFVAIGNLDALPVKGPKGQIEVPLRVVLRYRSMSGVANAVAAGIGLAPLPDLMFEDPAFRDVLKPVLTDYPLQEPTLHIVYVSRKHLPLKIRAYIDFVQEKASAIQPPRLAAAGKVCPATAPPSFQRKLARVVAAPREAGNQGALIVGAPRPELIRSDAP